MKGQMYKREINRERKRERERVRERERGNDNCRSYHTLIYLMKG